MYNRYVPPRGKDEETYTRVDMHDSPPPEAPPAAAPEAHMRRKEPPRDAPADKNRLGGLIRSLNIHLDAGDILLILILFFLSMESDDEEIVILLILILLMWD